MQPARFASRKRGQQRQAGGGGIADGASVQERRRGRNLARLHAQARERFDRALLEAALEHTGGRRTEAATRLGLGRNTVTRKLGASRKRR